MPFRWVLNNSFAIQYSDKYDECYKQDKLKEWLAKLHPQKKWCLAKQNHSNRVVTVDELACYDNYDGLVCGDKNKGLVIFGSDCPGLILVTKDCHFAAAHCGWRGTASGIVENTVSTLSELSGSPVEEWTAFIGPGISQKFFEVGEDVYNLPVWKKETIKLVSNKKAYLNLSLNIEFQLNELGIKDIVQSSVCTYNEDDLHSYRRDNYYANQVLAVYFRD